MDHLHLSKDPLDVGELYALATSPKCGAISLFVGTTRDNFDGKPVLKLEYEAYDSMVLKTLKDICNRMRDQWPNLENIVIYHRIGIVPVLEASIVIAISSPHRKDAIQATEWCIDHVKKNVPIWKKEIYENEQSQWKENVESTVYPPKCKKIKYDQEPSVDVPFVSPHLIQIKVSNNELNQRIESFMERKRGEINESNIREFCHSNRDIEATCARIDAVLQKRKDSKGHLQVSRVLNTYHRDQTNSAYMTKYLPQNGIDERVENLEIQLSLKTSVPQNIYRRLKRLEDRLLHLESISPEYVNFWDKTDCARKFEKKKVFSMEEIDSLIYDLERKPT